MRLGKSRFICNLKRIKVFGKWIKPIFTCLKKKQINKIIIVIFFLIDILNLLQWGVKASQNAPHNVERENAQERTF